MVNKNKIKKYLSLIFMAVLGLGVNANLALAGVCNNGLDDDGDGKCDYSGICSPVITKPAWLQGGNLSDEGCSSADGINETYDGEMRIANIYRISHPAVTLSNIYQTFRSPWNSDYSRIMLLETGTKGEVFNPDKTRNYFNLRHPWYPYDTMINFGLLANDGIENNEGRGRGLIWGCITDACVTKRASVSGNTVTSTLQDLDLDITSNTNTKLAEWAANTGSLSKGFYFTYSQKYNEHAIWSPYVGEEDCIYATTRTSQSRLVRYCIDVDTETNIINIPIDNNAADVWDFYGDKTRLVIDLVYFNGGKGGNGGNAQPWTVILSSDGRHRDLSASVDSNAPINAPAACSDLYLRTAYHGGFPRPHSLHGSWSLDGQIKSATNASCNNGLAFNSDYEGVCAGGGDWGASGFTPQGLWVPDRKGNEKHITHHDFLSSNEWMFGGNIIGVGGRGGVRYPFLTSRDLTLCTAGSFDSHACIGEEIYQIKVDRDIAYACRNEFNCSQASNPNSCDAAFQYNLLISKSNAAIWTPVEHPFGGSDQNYGPNYMAMPSPTARPDLEQIYFQGTNDRYTHQDKAFCDENPGFTNCNFRTNPAMWEGIGGYIAYLVPVSSNPADVNSDGRVNVKDIQEVIRCIINANCGVPRADVNNDGRINIKDIQEIIRKIINPS